MDSPHFDKDKQFVQFAADNIDHNIRTLDGHNTFHGMGMIAMVTPRINQSRQIPKITVSANDIAEIGKVNIQFCTKFTKLVGTKYEVLSPVDTIDPTFNLNILWKASMLLKPPCMAWSGMILGVHIGIHPGKSEVVFLPMINMDPTDMSCIFSTLLFLCEQATKCNVTPIVTFDQPLWWKAKLIVSNKSDSIDVLKTLIVRLGGLHTEMSFLGCIGYLMNGSGLRELAEVIYAPNAVSHILSGAAIARAIREHILVVTVLSTLLLEDIYNISIPTDGTADISALSDEVGLLKCIYDELFIILK